MEGGSTIVDAYLLRLFDPADRRTPQTGVKLVSGVRGLLVHHCIYRMGFSSLAPAG